MTLNQVIQRLQTIAENHRQINSFQYGAIADWLANAQPKAECPVMFVDHSNGNISTTQRLTTHNFNIYLLDLVNASNNAMSNETEVLSDMLSVAEDVISIIKSPDYENATLPWFSPGDAAVSMVVDDTTDRMAGVLIAISISTLFEPNRCQVPTL